MNSLPMVVARSPPPASRASVAARTSRRLATAILRNTEQLMTELLRIDGIRLNSRTAPARRSGIVSFRHETIASGTLYQGLRERGISCALREGGVRVSPHFYQGESELAVFLDALAHMV